MRSHRTRHSMLTLTLTPREFGQFKSWVAFLEDWRAKEDSCARAENAYMKWLLSRHTGELKIVPVDLAA